MVVLHCCNRSPGSEVGKNTAAGRPLAGGSNRNPTAVRSACQPGMPPTLFSTLCWEVYMELCCPFWIRCNDFSTCGETTQLTVQDAVTDWLSLRREVAGTAGWETANPRLILACLPQEDISALEREASITQHSQLQHHSDECQYSLGRWEQ